MQVGGGQSLAMVAMGEAQTQVQWIGGSGSHDDALCRDLQLPLLGSVLSARSPMVSSITNQEGTTVFSLGATFWANDATNSSIWQRQKLQGLMVHSSIMVDWHALQREDYATAFRTLKAMSLHTTWHIFSLFGRLNLSIHSDITQPRPAPPP